MIIERNAIARYLQQGAVGVGETHNQPASVHAIIKCILKHPGSVRQIFIELWPAHSQSTIDSTRQKYLMTDGDPEEKATEAFECIRTVLHGQGCKSWKTFAMLIVVAIVNDIPVTCAEASTAFLTLAAKLEMGVSRRNIATLELIKGKLGVGKWNDQGAIGSILLFGSDHFSLRGGNFVSLEEGFGNMPWYNASGRRVEADPDVGSRFLSGEKEDEEGGGAGPSDGTGARGGVRTWAQVKATTGFRSTG